MKMNDILVESFTDAKRIFSQTEDNDTVEKYLNTFKDLAKRNIITGKEKDISYWIKQGWDSFKELVDSNKDKTTKSQSKKSKKKDSIVVHEDNDKMVVIPLSKDASCYYGKQTKWCTASTESKNYFEEYFYDKNIVLFYILTKDGKRYASAYATKFKRTEFFDEEDEAMSYLKFVTATGVTQGMLTDWIEEYAETIKAARMNRIKEQAIAYAKQKDMESLIDLLIDNNLRVKEVESYIATNPTDAQLYAEKVLNRPFPEAEDTIATDANASFSYAKQLGQRFEKGESAIASNASVSLAYAYEVIDGPFPKGEDAIATSPRHSVIYAKDVLKGPFPKGEDVISKDDDAATKYAISVLKGAFPEGEDVISRIPITSFRYATEALEGPFPKGEHEIAQNEKYAYFYAKDILKGPFPKGEEAIGEYAQYRNQYYEFLLTNGFKNEAKKFEQRYMD